jgi:hypothetical protein
MTIRIGAASVILAIAATALVTVPAAAPAVAAGSTSFVVDPATTGQALGDLSSTVTSWDLNQDWTTAATGRPSNYFATNYPSITTADLFSATGGGYTSQSDVVSYYTSGMTGATVTALFQTSVEPAATLKFWVTTTDPEFYQQVTSVTTTDTSIAAGSWMKRVYSVSGIPSGATSFRISFPTGGLNAYNPQLAKVQIAATTPITDDLADWSKTGSHSPGLQLDTSNAALLGDSSRAMRTVKTRFTAAEDVIYQSSGMSAFSASALYATDHEAIDDLLFFTSPDNATWTQQVGWSKVDSAANGGLWTKRVYSLTSLPGGTAYVRVTFPTGGANPWNPQLGSVTVTGSSSYTDALTDWTKSFYHSSGLAFDTSNATALGDPSRAMRTNTYEGFPGATVNRDLFKNPQDRNTLTDYDFSTLITAAHNIVAQGLKPKIRLANIPMKFSAAPVLGEFKTNIRPPDDVAAYSTYIKAIADAVKAEFGLDEVKTWTWGLTPEIENQGWLKASDGTSATTRSDFFRIYDYTVKGLEDSLGASNVTVGVHMMNQTTGLWNPLDLIDHVTAGTNLATGATGTQLDYIDFSYYEGGEGNTGQLETTAAGARSLVSSVERIRSYAVAHGLTGLRYGVAEGGIAFDQNGKFILNNTVGTGYEASFDALVYKKLTDAGISDWSRWTLSTEKIWGGIPGVSTHIDNLVDRMASASRVDVARSGAEADATDIVDTVAGFDSAAHTIDLLAFNHNPSPTGGTTEDVSTTIRNITPVSGSSVTVTRWQVDDSHANFWQTWWSDRTAHGVSNQTVNGYSPESLTVPALLTVQADKDYWYSRQSAYQSLAQLTSTTSTVTPTGGSITLTDSISQHGVVFYEISNVKLVASPASPSTTLADPLANWYRTNSHSSGLTFDTGNGGVFADSSRVMRTDATVRQSVDYWKLRATTATVTALFDTGDEPIADLQFFTSNDGVTWAAFAGASTSDTAIGTWTRRTYSLSGLPAGTNYLRIAFPTGGLNVWNPQLGQVDISS